MPAKPIRISANARGTVRLSPQNNDTPKATADTIVSAKKPQNIATFSLITALADGLTEKHNVMLGQVLRLTHLMTELRCQSVDIKP